VALEIGDNTFTLSNIGRGGPNIDRLVVGATTPFRVEVEDMPLLSRFEPVRNSAASGGVFLQAVGPQEQRAGFHFEGPSGVYDVGVGHFDENDGVARMGLFVNGVAVDAFLWDQDLGFATPGPSTQTIRQVSGVFIETGALVELRGFGVPGEPIRTDFLDFAFVAPAPAGGAPFAAFPEAALTLADTPLAFNDGYTSSVFDDDGDRLTVTLRPDVGTVSAAASPATQIMTGNGAVLSLSGAQDDVNRALAGLVYTPSAGFLGDAVIDIAVTDGGLVTTDQIALTVTGAFGQDSHIAVESLDPTFFPDRLQFNWIDAPTQNATTPRAFKADAMLRVTNEGVGPLTLTGHRIEGPFTLVDPDRIEGLTLALGEFVDVAVRFDRDAFTERANNVSGVVGGRLEILSDDPAQGAAPITLSAFWQRVDEGGWEPNVNEVWELFGFGNVIPGLAFRDDLPSPLFKDGLYEAFDDTEVLSPHWRIADGVDEAQITMIARYSGPTSGFQPLTIHRPFSKSAVALTFGATEPSTQTVLPGIAAARGGEGVSFDGVFASARFTRDSIPDIWQGDGVFGIAAANFSSDPNINGKGDIPADAPPEAIFGQWLRLFQALDADGVAIPNVYLGFQDFIGINGDFNETMFIIEGVTPVSTAPVNTVPAGVSTTGGQPFVFGSANRIRVDDADSGLTPRFNVHLSVQDGVLDVGSAPGVAVSGGGTAQMHLFGAPSAVNEALRALSYTADARFSGVDMLRIVSNDRALSDEDFVPIAVAPAPARLAIEGLDDAAADARLVFTNINPDSASLRPGQSFRNEATFEIINEGGMALSIDGIALGDASAFTIVGPTSTVLAPGARVAVTVAFTGIDPTSRDATASHPALARLPEFYETTLTVTTSAGAASVTLAGLAQFASENGQEPQPFQLARAFGYATDIPFDQLPVQGDPAVVETIGDEVLAPYFSALDASAPVEIIQLAALLGARQIDGQKVGDVARLFVHDPASAADRVELFGQASEQNQTVLPRALDGGQTRAAFTPDGPFGVYISVDGRPDYATWSDPGANETDPALRRDGAPLTGDGDPRTPDGGHLLRYFEARAADGAVMPGAYLAIQDYPGVGNFDFNDHVFLIRNVAPLQRGALPPTIDPDGDGINDALIRDLDGDGLVAFFDPDDAPVRVEAEDFALLQGFKIVNRGAASGGAHLEAVDAAEQIARHVFDGRAGVYDLALGHFDENDGVASMRVLVNGAEVDSFLWSRDTGAAGPTGQSLVEHMIGSVTLRPGDVIDLRGFGVRGEPLRTDYLDFAFRGEARTPEPVRVEAEDFTLVQGLKIMDRSAASGGANIEASGPGQQIATHVFAGPSGVYRLDLGYFDENDAVASMQVLVNDVQVDAFLWDRDLGSAFANPLTLTERSIEAVTLQSGDVIMLRGQTAVGEPLRTDYLDFIWTDNLLA